MWELRFLGRGGQGAVLAAELLAEAAFRDGKVPQSFPFFGVERRGAPVTAYARVSDRTITVRGSIAEPDMLVVLEPGLLRAAGATAGLREHGWVLVNAPPERVGLAVPPHARLATVDATRIAREHRLGPASLPIVNTALLGAVARLTDVVSLRSLEGAIAQHVPRAPEANVAACRDGYASVEERHEPSARVAPAAVARSTPFPVPDGPVATVPSATIATASWRTLRPEIRLDRCTRCEFCWKFCPDVAIELDAVGYPHVRSEHCKGCGICAEVCPPRTIAMVEEA
jgi:2-oxoacid:acceptor oxidoreductase gamma subunit (pyruvate/2-ketoisovalerate family)/2-oxoacid:acceptor oxidoreductase delta subunit (pyruvate/2-ketoisovalerate family)